MIVKNVINVVIVKNVINVVIVKIVINVVIVKIVNIVMGLVMKAIKNINTKIYNVIH